METGRFIEKTSRTIRQCGIIILLSIVAGLSVNQFRGDTLPLVADWSPEVRLADNSGENLVISLEEARALCLDKRAIFLDARPPADYTQGHIQCALNLPWQDFDKYIDVVLDKIPEDTLIVTYCDGETCSLSEDLARELISMGYEKVNVLPNGWTRWREAGFPTGEKGNT